MLSYIGIYIYCSQSGDREHGGIYCLHAKMADSWSLCHLLCFQCLSGFFHIGTLLFKAHVTFTFFHPITSTSIALHCLFEILFQWTQLVIITSILEKYYGVSTLAVYWTSMIYMVIVTLMIVTLMIYMIIMTLVILLLSYICCSRNIEKLTIQKLNLVHGSSP